MLDENQNQLDVKEVTEADAESAFDLLLKYFYPEEYIACALGVLSEDITSQREFIRRSCGSGLGLKCVNTATGELVGIRLTSGYNGSKESPPADNFVDRAIDALLKAAKQGLETLLPDARKIANFDMLCVKHEYRRYGVAVKMIEKSMALLKSRGFDYVVVVAANTRPQTLYDKLHFTRLREIIYADFEVEDKHPFVYDDGLGTTKLVLFAKKL